MPILGINHSVDAAAALVRQGKVVAASAEERFTRRKHDASFPQQAVSWALRANDLALEDCHAHTRLAQGKIFSPRIHVFRLEGTKPPLLESRGAGRSSALRLNHLLLVQSSNQIRSMVSV